MKLQTMISIALCLLTLVALKESVWAQKQYFVSTFGSDSNPGTINRPFRTITKGIGVLEAGDVLNLRKGVYVESVEIKGKNGSANNNIVIRSFPGEHAIIDGSVAQFRVANNNDWEPAALHDPNAHKEEFVSRDTFTLDSNDDRVNRGAFLDRKPYTRLITYSKLDDLRAENETFDQIALNDPRPGPEETDAAGNGTGFRRPWVYMGPGVFFNQQTGRAHIRLSHTHNGVEGLADYDGKVDPRLLRLAISHKDRATLVIRNSSFVRFENISIRFGGEHTVEIHVTEGVVFDHIRVLASSHGVFMGAGNSGTIFRHCEIDGGLPTWYFRTDRKAEYHFKEGDTVVLNILGKQTSRALFFGNKDNVGTEIYNCEFVNAHDFYFAGQRLQFRHNWIHNLNDEAIFFDAAENSHGLVHENVITQCLSAISFAGEKVSGPWFIYRNLIDLRSPTAGKRPKFPGDKDVFRFGHLYKGNPPDGALHLFQNTFLVLSVDDQASYRHYRATDTKPEETFPRHSFNNIFVAVNPTPDFDKAISFVPSPSFPGPTDGHCYFRIGFAERPLLRFLAYKFNGQCFKKGEFETLDELKDSLLFEQSKTQYAPGYEANSVEVDPQFRQIGAAGSVQETDDLRLRSSSPLRKKGIVLPSELKSLDPFAPTQGKPDIGCYPLDSSGLSVGVDGRRRFPKGKL